MKLLTLLISFTLFANQAFANDSVFQVNDIETKFTKFNSQKIRAYAVDVATKRGFNKLLENIIPQEYNVKEVIDSIDLKELDVVERLTIVNEINKTGNYTATFDILYNQEVIKDILQQKRIPYIQNTMGNVLLMPIYQTPNQENLVFEDSNTLKPLLFNYLQNSLLIKPVLAKGDLNEITTYNAANLLDDNNKDNILKLAKSYNVNKAVIVYLQQNNYDDENVYQVNLKFINFDSIQDTTFMVLGQTIEQVSKEIATKIKALWQDANLLEFNKPKRFMAKINSNGDIKNIYNILEKLKMLDLVSVVQIKQINTQYAFVQTDFYGTPTEFLAKTKQHNLNIFQSEDKEWIIETLKDNN